MAREMSNNQPVQAINLQEGKYKFQFLLDSKLITEIPFSITRLANPDTYTTVKNKYFIEGPWAEYVFLKFEGKKTKKIRACLSLIFTKLKILLLTRKEYIGYYQLFKDGKMIANTYGKYPAEDERKAIMAYNIWNEEGSLQASKQQRKTGKWRPCLFQKE